MQRYREFGAEIRRRFSRSAARTSGKGAALEMALGRPVRTDHVVHMEEIAEGARVRDYAVEAQANGQWQELCGGTSIGHKKIDRFVPVEVQRLRLNVKKAVAEPLIRSFAAYCTQ